MQLNTIEFYSDCCDAEILCPDQNGHGFCSDCGDNATPVEPEKEIDNED